MSDLCCAVCLAPRFNNDPHSLPCGHTYCGACCGRLLAAPEGPQQRKCPQCKTPIAPDVTEIKHDEALLTQMLGKRDELHRSMEYTGPKSKREQFRGAVHGLSYFDQMRTIEDNDDNIAFAGHFNTRSGSLFVLAHMNVNENELYVRSSMAAKVPAARRAVIWELLARLNFGMKVGFFVLDQDDGELVYKSNVYLHGLTISTEFIDNLVDWNLIVQGEFHEAFMMLMYGGISAEAAYAIAMKEMPPDDAAIAEPEVDRAKLSPLAVGIGVAGLAALTFAWLRIRR
eukprot:TRINITY_DN23474_c0_g1_i1.p1 TRINITY_DN23474_c0_g1~~TRINITY_DN23474_c0_g1_i1.p1  ORF type:complete len:285 (-),score=70.17 TRINITY_DN23474_c0_g1_i1:9-863(-)